MSDLFLDQEPLFKTAQAVGTPLPEDAATWPQQILEELHKQCPFLGIYEVDTHIEKINPTQSTALGFFIVRPNVTKETVPKEQPLPEVKIPIIVNDRLLSPFDIMVGPSDDFMPLSENRVKQILEYASPMELYVGDHDGIDQVFRPRNQGMFSNMMQGVGNGFFMGKMGSVLEALNGKVDRATAAEFVNASNERTMSEVLYKTANRQELGIVGRRVLELIKTAASVTRVPNPEYPTTPNVMLIERDGESYRVKVADTAAYSPMEVRLTSAQAQTIFGNDTLTEVDKTGALVYGPQHAIVEEPQGLQKVAEVLNGALAGGFSILDVDGVRHDGAVFNGYLDFSGYYQPGYHFLSKTANAWNTNFFGIGDPGVTPPDDKPANGTQGMFYDPTTFQAYEPVFIKTAVYGPGIISSYLAAEDGAGLPLKLTIMDGPVKVASLGERHYAIPAFYKYAEVRGKRVTPVDLEVLREQAYPQLIKIARFSDGRFSITGPAADHIPAQHRVGVDLADALFATRSLGMSFEQSMDKFAQVAAQDNGGTIEVRGEFLNITPYAQRQEQFSEYVIKCASIVPERPPLDELIKIAAILEDGTTVDSVLSLGFIKPDTLSTFVEYLPSLEQATHNLAELLFAVRLGVSYVPEIAAARGMQYLNAVVEGLNKLKQTIVAGDRLA